jgi:hypothetical protein
MNFEICPSHHMLGVPEGHGQNLGSSSTQLNKKVWNRTILLCVCVCVCVRACVRACVCVCVRVRVCV